VRPAVEWPLHQATIQRKAACACGGGCPRCVSESDGEQVQAKFAISSPSDHFEQEANRIADQVMRMPSSEEHGFNAAADEVPATSPGLNERILRHANASRRNAKLLPTLPAGWVKEDHSIRRAVAILSHASIATSVLCAFMQTMLLHATRR
jgi:hypothetical protein